MGTGVSPERIATGRIILIKEVRFTRFAVPFCPAHQVPSNQVLTKLILRFHSDSLSVLLDNSTVKHIAIFYFFFLRKEVIQPHLPIRLPCYDFTPVIGPAFGSSFFAVRSLTSGVTDSHGVTGGVYKTRERIHRGILIRDY